MKWGMWLTMVVATFTTLETLARIWREETFSAWTWRMLAIVDAYVPLPIVAGLVIGGTGGVLWHLLGPAALQQR